MKRFSFWAAFQFSAFIKLWPFYKAFLIRYLKQLFIKRKKGGFTLRLLPRDKRLRCYGIVFPNLPQLYRSGTQ